MCGVLRISKPLLLTGSINLFFSLLPIFISWSIWITQNKVVFQNISPNVMSCGIKGISLFNEYMVSNLSKKMKRTYPPGTTSFCAEGFFDGASSNSYCGCGMMLSLNKDHYFTLCLGGGKGSNTKADLMSFWGLLQFAAIIGISNINIFHDSKVLIEWINGNYNIQALVIKNWYQRVQLLKSFFI